VRLQSLPKAGRLKSRKSIQTLFREGKAFSVFPYKVYYRCRAASSPALLTGFGVSSRFFKRAVDRNRIKRLGREAWRRGKHVLEDSLRDGALEVFLVYTGRQLPEYALVSGKIAVILDKLKKQQGAQPDGAGASDAGDETHQ
jgi:ribonuclease P protein component